MYEEVISTNPTHRLAAHANYWFALREYQSNQWRKAEEYALSVRRCLAPKPGLHWEWTLDGKAALLLKRIYGTGGEVDTKLYKPDFLVRLSRIIDADLAGLRL